jgi:hypothetical protein
MNTQVKPLTYLERLRERAMKQVNLAPVKPVTDKTNENRQK